MQGLIFYFFLMQSINPFNFQQLGTRERFLESDARILVWDHLLKSPLLINFCSSQPLSRICSCCSSTLLSQNKSRFTLLTICDAGTVKRETLMEELCLNRNPRFFAKLVFHPCIQISDMKIFLNNVQYYEALSTRLIVFFFAALQGERHGGSLREIGSGQQNERAGGALLFTKVDIFCVLIVFTFPFQGITHQQGGSFVF